MAIFTKEEAQRFAALMAGFDVGNPSEAEAVSKGGVLRRMAAEKKIRVVDAWELPEIRAAIDKQLNPVRAVANERIDTVIRCDCEPWPMQMMWWFVGVLAWCAKGSLWILEVLGAFALGCLVGFWEGLRDAAMDKFRK
jgi:imidazolonepropionase-like amidohydrolase